MRELHDRGYREPGEPPLTHADVRARLSLAAITLHDGASELHLDDDELLWGHQLSVTCEPDGTARRVDFVG